MCKRITVAHCSLWATVSAADKEAWREAVTLAVEVPKAAAVEEKQFVFQRVSQVQPQQHRPWAAPMRPWEKAIGPLSSWDRSH